MLAILNHFKTILQIEENTKGLSSLNYSFSGSTSSLESIRSPTMEINRKADGAKKTLLKWVGTVIPKYVLHHFELKQLDYNAILYLGKVI